MTSNCFKIFHRVTAKKRRRNASLCKIHTKVRLRIQITRYRSQSRLAFPISHIKKLRKAFLFKARKVWLKNRPRIWKKEGNGKASAISSAFVYISVEHRVRAKCICLICLIVIFFCQKTSMVAYRFNSFVKQKFENCNLYTWILLFLFGLYFSVTVALHVYDFSSSVR